MSDIADVNVLPQGEEKDNHSSSEGSFSEKDYSKEGYKHDVEVASAPAEDDDDGHVLEDARDLVSHVITVSDDPSENPWTFRMWLIGLGLSTFGGVLGVLPHTICSPEILIAIFSRNILL